MSLLAQAHADRVGREHGLTMQQWELLAHLRRAGGELDVRTLCCGLGVAPPTLSALTDGAEARGWIERRAHPDDRRRRVLALTPAGAELVERVPHLGREVGRTLTHGLDASERQTLARLLERAARNLEAAR